MRFSINAQRVLIATRNEALQIRHNYIGTDHLLLGFLHDEGPAGAILRIFGLNLAKVEELAERIYRTEGHDPKTKMELALDLTMTISLAVHEAKEQRKKLIGIEQLFVSMLSQPLSHAFDIFKELNIRPESLREEFQMALGGGPPALFEHRPPTYYPLFVQDDIPEHLSENAQRALDLARKDAKQRNHRLVSTVHLLIGLVSVEGQAQRILTYLGVDVNRVEEAVAHLYPTVQIVFGLNVELSPELKDVFLLAVVVVSQHT